MSGDIVERYATRAEELAEGGKFEWWTGLAALLRSQADLITTLTAQRDEARRIVRDIHWMAVRYADGRQSYAVGMCNDALLRAYEAGWLVHSEFRQHDLDPQYARDGSKPEYRHLEARAATAEASLSTALLQVEALTRALEPFANVVFNDNGDVTYTTSAVLLEDYWRAYQALRSLSKEGETS